MHKGHSGTLVSSNRNNKIWTLSWTQNRYFTPIPKEPSIEYCRLIIYEVFEYFSIDQYIQKIVWDTPDAIFPAISFPDAPRDKWEYIHSIANDLIAIIRSAWNLGG